MRPYEAELTRVSRGGSSLNGHAGGDNADGNGDGGSGIGKDGDAMHVNEPPMLLPACVSAIEHGHRTAASALQWLPRGLEISKTGDVIMQDPTLPPSHQPETHQLVSVAPDATAFFWDLRLPGSTTPAPLANLHLAWTPLLPVYLPANTVIQVNCCCCGAVFCLIVLVVLF